MAIAITKKEIKAALRLTTKDLECHRVGPWRVWAKQIYSPGVGYAWYWHYYAQHDNGPHAIGGWRRIETAADYLARHQEQPASC